MRYQSGGRRFHLSRRPRKHYIVKHIICNGKSKPIWFERGVYGQAQIYRWRTTDVTNAKKIIQYVLENLNLGGRQLKIFDLVSYTAPKTGKDAAEIDRGFQFIQNEGPRPATEMAQLRWMTKKASVAQALLVEWCTRQEGVRLANSFD